MELIKKENGFLVSAKELYSELGMKTRYADWIKESIERACLDEEKDFIRLLGKSTGGRPSTDYLLKKEAAITIIVMSGGQFAKDLRKKVIELYNQHDTGLAFTSVQFEALMDLSKAMTLVSIQKDVEAKHFNMYNDKYSWYEYRAAVLGYSTKSLIEKMKEINKKHKTMRASLILLDANELIRTGVIDLMIAMGKTIEYAKNVGDLCKSISEKSEFANIIWDDTKPNPLGINACAVQERKILFNKNKEIE